MPTSHGIAQKEHHRVVSDRRALLRPYAPKRSKEGGKKLKILEIFARFEIKIKSCGRIWNEYKTSLLYYLFVEQVAQVVDRKESIE